MVLEAAAVVVEEDTEGAGRRDVQTSRRAAKVTET